jgi:hypothetical protein
MKEAEMMISEAEIQGEKVLDAAPPPRGAPGRGPRRDEALRGRVAAALRASLEHHLQLVEHLSEDPGRRRPPQWRGRIEALVRRREPRSGG